MLANIVKILLFSLNVLNCTLAAVHDSSIFGWHEHGVPFNHGDVYGNTAIGARVRMTCQHSGRLDYIKIDYLAAEWVIGTEELGDKRGGFYSDAHTFDKLDDIRDIQVFVCVHGKHNGMICGLKINPDSLTSEFTCGRVVSSDSQAIAAQDIVHIPDNSLFRSWRGETIESGLVISKLGWSWYDK